MTELSPALSDEILATAMSWHQRLDEGEFTIDDEAALEVWLQADDRHRFAFEQMGQMIGVFDQHAASPELLGARRALLRRVHREARDRWTGSRRMPTRRMAGAMLAASFLAAAGVWSTTGQGEVYKTGAGERRVIILEDGSVVSLDAMTKVSVRYSKAERRLRLERGQARFDVAHDASRPFSVTARDRKVVATGTAFNIDLLAPVMRVTLIEGHVVVLPEATSALLSKTSGKEKAVELRSGQVLVARTNRGPALVDGADLRQTTSWQQGQLAFAREPLGEAVERVNRYTDRKITVGDDKAAQILLSGTFNAGDVKAFLEAVGEFLPVRVVDGPDGPVIQSIQGA
jgi:transmembrane sensor